MHLKSSLLDTAARCVKYEQGDPVADKELKHYWEIIENFVWLYRNDPNLVASDLAENYTKDSLKLMDQLVKYNNTPAILR